MNLNLRVRGFHQENEMGCGAAALRSVLDFFGKTASEKDIIHAAGGIFNNEGYHGILSIHAAVALYKIGFKIHAYTYNMKLLKPEWVLINSNALIEHLETLKEKLIKARKKTSANIAESMIYLIENKQDIKLKFPKKEDIIYFLKKGMPVLISVRARIFFQNSAIDAESGHYLVVSGYDGKNFSVIDPYDGKEKVVEENLLLLAWCNNALDSTDFLLAIEPRRRAHH